MKILLTGSAGFIGGHVLERLLGMGHEVVGVDLLDERVHPNGKPAWYPESPLIVCNVADIPYWAYAEAEVVIHLAAQVSVADSMENPKRYIDHNTAGTAALLTDLRRAANLRRVVVASSMSVYGEGGQGVKETDAVSPASVYGLTKYDQERLCLMWGRQHRKAAVALRFFNVYGPRQALHNGYTGVLSIFANRLLRDEPPIVYEDGSQTRDFIYVEDVARAVVETAVSENDISGVFNICTGKPTTILRAARHLATALQRPIEPTITGTERPGDIRHCTGDPGRAKNLLGFQARWAFEQGIQEYADWLTR